MHVLWISETVIGLNLKVLVIIFYRTEKQTVSANPSLQIIGWAISNLRFLGPFSSSVSFTLGFLPLYVCFFWALFLPPGKPILFLYPPPTSPHKAHLNGSERDEQYQEMFVLTKSMLVSFSMSGKDGLWPPCFTLWDKHEVMSYQISDPCFFSFHTVPSLVSHF